MTRVAPLNAAASPRSRCKATVAKLCLLVITLLRIAANLYWGHPVDAYTKGTVGLLKDWPCSCSGPCENPDSDPGGAWCNYSSHVFREFHCGDLMVVEGISLNETHCHVYYPGCLELNITWGYCSIPIPRDFGPSFDSYNNRWDRVRLNAVRSDLVVHRWKFRYTTYAYRIDFMALANYFVRPLISALGVYMFLSRPERCSAQSRLHVWCYRSVLWLFVTSTFTDDSITGLHLVIWKMHNAYYFPEPGSWRWSPVQSELFVIGITISNLFQMHIANLKLKCLLWNRSAFFATFLAAALVLAWVGSTVNYIDSQFRWCTWTPRDDGGCIIRSRILSTGGLFLTCSILICLYLLGPLQSVGMWRVACKVAHASGSDELRSEFRCLCASAFLTMVGSPLSASLIAYFRLDWTSSSSTFFQIFMTLDLICQTFGSLLLGGLIGPHQWSKPMDLFSSLAQSRGMGLAAKRIAFPGQINLSADECIVSFPGKYSEEWDRAVAVASEEESCSLACVFLTDAASGLGQHVNNPESPNGDCYCKALYGSVPPEAYMIEVDLTDPDNPINKEQLAFRKADAKAMGQMLLIKHSHTTQLEWNEKKSEAMRKARECWQQSQRRAPWGCAWFALWKENVDAAVAKNQSLHVFYFEGRVGAGKVSWDQLGNEETRKNACDGGGLGASQTAEVAYLDKLGLPYTEHDVMEFNSFIVREAPLRPEEVGLEVGPVDFRSIPVWPAFAAPSRMR